MTHEREGHRQGYFGGRAGGAAEGEGEYCRLLRGPKEPAGREPLSQPGWRVLRVVEISLVCALLRPAAERLHPSD